MARRIVKYCEKQHNVAEGCNTLHLGTFQYYRELDPSFSIGDVEEGYIHFREPENPITITAEQHNLLTGGAIQISDRTTAGRPVMRIPGGVSVEQTGNEVVFGEDGVCRIHIKGTFDAKLYYPNAYVFSTAILEDGEKPDPSSVLPKYDSYYEIKSKSIGGFIETISTCLLEQLSLRDLKIGETEMEKMPVKNLFSPLGIQIIRKHAEVQKVPEKQIRLNNPEDFDKSKMVELYAESMFKKNEAKLKGNEYRFIFFLRHAVAGWLSVQKEPKILDLKPIAQYLNP